MSKLNKKGFTLIELLVVIAIIGILAAIVLVSLNSARNKGYDTEIKSEIAQIRDDIELYYDDNGGSYSGYTIPSTLTPPKCSSDTSYQIAISTDGQKYAVWADLCAANDDWCVDSTGVSKNIAVSAGATKCP